MPLKTKKERAKWQRIWRLERYLKGICQECKEPVYKDKTRCRKHLIQHSEATKRWKHRNDRQNYNPSQSI